jgi:hypothetical protein
MYNYLLLKDIKMSRNEYERDNRKRQIVQQELEKLPRDRVVGICGVLRHFSQNSVRLLRTDHECKQTVSELSAVADVAIMVQNDYETVFSPVIGKGEHPEYFVFDFNRHYSQKHIPNIRKFSENIIDHSTQNYDVPDAFIRTLKELRLSKAAYVLEKAKFKHDHNKI